MSFKVNTRGRWSRKALVAASLLALMATSACGGGGNSEGSADQASGDIKIFVIGGKSDDPFWSKVKRGVDDAGDIVKGQGGSVTFIGPQNYDNLGPDAAKLVDSAISQGADVLIAPNWVPEAQNEAFKRAVAKDVPLFLYNAGGIESADDLGAVNYVGTEEYKAGQAGGQYLGQQDLTNVICVNTLPGATNTEDRCRGLADGLAESGGKSTQLPLPTSQFGNKTAVAQAIKAALLETDDIDGVVTIGTVDSDSAVTAVDQAGVQDKVKLGTFDTDDTALNRVKDGTLLFAIDQQPYLQGYLAVSMANAYVRYGLSLPQRPILTGPAVVTAENVDLALVGAKAGVR